MSRPKLPGLSEGTKATFTDAIGEVKDWFDPIVAEIISDPGVTRTDARRVKQLADGIHARLLQLEAWVTTGNWIGEAKPKPEQGNG